MNDYALHQAQLSGNLAGVGPLEKLIRNWLARRAVSRLQDLDDHLLRDIGASRQDIAWALRQPLSQNAALLLDERQRKARGTKHV